MKFNEWIDLFVEEKKINKSEVFVVTHKEIIHFVEFSQLLDYIKGLSIEVKKKIKNNIAYIDFRNGNLMGFFDYMANGYIIANYR